ncbi:hypothetical protein Pmar_PMAR013079 [Perkinsus marinus ATCC 50983]|uniref:Uncharacterized protein n=1 Tax=Perkinsus marinus (strain ATCC 50983 / TXsc) TaxID=423536 RepID=C5KUS7_PERM5|nr:hypothetical protein Pmar_PMAR013079 [Perkinsus marinus ATCC 50983]EER11798.1 hypothetical protein Pmar_PMAR013079 [Perkinsus marinus ATCC 50983]|eukprot:XP_002780003.1 hypothetical protein Pmar_PMAR013079 [Perkinsus marinus ATCC 50983]
MARGITRLAAQETAEWEASVGCDVTLKVWQWVHFVRSSKFVSSRLIDLSKVYVFCDASFHGWSCVILDARLSVVFGRCGLFPPRSGLTIPRKELEAFYQGILTLKKICPALPHNDPSQAHEFSPMKLVSFFADSAILIYRLRGRQRSGEDKLSVAECRRVQASRGALLRWGATAHHIPGSLNVADGPSRPYSSFDTLKNKDEGLADLRYWLKDVEDLGSQFTLTFDPIEASNIVPDIMMAHFTKDPSCQMASVDTVDVEAIRDQISQLQQNDPWCQDLIPRLKATSPPPWTRYYALSDDDILLRVTSASSQLVVPSTGVATISHTQLAKIVR